MQPPTVTPFQPTLTEHDASQRRELRPWEAFDADPSLASRKEAMKALASHLERFPIDDPLSEWVEQRINELLSTWGLDRDFGRNLLRVYIFNLYGKRACEFALGFLERDRELGLNLRKNLISRMKRDSSLYWRVPGMRDLVAAALSHIDIGSGCDKEHLTKVMWEGLRRAVDCVAYATDISMLGSLVESRDALKAALALGASRFAGYREFVLRMCIAGWCAYLDAAIAIFEEERAEQWPDLSLIIGGFLKQKGGIEGNVEVRHLPLYQVRFDDLSADGHFDFLLAFVCDDEERPKLENALESLELHYFAGLEDIGSTIPIEAVSMDQVVVDVPANQGVKSGEVLRGFSFRNVAQEVALRVFLRRGMNRFHLGFRDWRRRKDLCTLVTYVEAV